MARKKRITNDSKNTTSGANTKKNNKNSIPATSALPFDKLLTSNNLEFVTALLLLTEKLKVESILLSRKGGVEVTLIGEFCTIDDTGKSSRVEQLASFLKQNGGMTMDEVFSAFKKRLSE